jgi:protein gp37
MRRGIEWTDLTWNPSIGCSRVSEGCRLCYAEHVAAMIVRTTRGDSPYASVVRTVGGEPRWTGVVRRNTDARFYLPRRLRPRTPPLKIFVNSMSDVFHEEAAASGLTTDIFHEMRMAPGHIYQVLTKRPAAAFCAAHPDVRHLPNVWLCVPVEDARVTDRIDVQRTIPVAVRGLSIEPLIGPLGRLNLGCIHWVIVEVESGAGARPMHVDWVREVRDQVKVAGLPLLFKQWGGPRSNKRGHDEAVLDGREWKEFPA